MFLASRSRLICAYSLLYNVLFVNKDTIRNKQTSSFDGGDNGEHKDIGSVEIPKIFAPQDKIVFGKCHLTEFAVFGLVTVD